MFEFATNGPIRTYILYMNTKMLVVLGRQWPSHPVDKLPVMLVTKAAVLEGRSHHQLLTADICRSIAASSDMFVPVANDMELDIGYFIGARAAAAAGGGLVCSPITQGLHRIFL